jgi:hypothetical protein
VGLVQLLSLLDDDSGAANPPRFFSTENKKHPAYQSLHTLTVGTSCEAIMYGAHLSETV